MIPDKLILQGLYSYQEKQTIDFNPLIEAGLFGIFGTVGSGKSALLDAITFALFGQTERLGTHDKRSYNMMNLKSNELLIDFSFYAGVRSSNKYRFVVRGKRSKKDFSNVGTFERRAFQWENETWNPLESASAESILGLSYTHFRRTIIIPQGKFREFLELTSKPRTEMLKEIFQLHKFDLAGHARHLDDQNKLALSKIEGELSSLGDVNEIQITAKRTELISTKQLLDISQKTLKTKVQAEKRMASLKDSFLELAKQTEINQKLNNQRDEFKKKEARLKIYHFCHSHYLPLKNSNNSLKARVEDLQKHIHKATEQQSNLENEIQESALTLQNLKLKDDRRDQELNKIRELQEYLDGRLVEKELVEKQKQLQQLSEQLAPDQKDWENRKKDLIVRKQGLTELVKTRTNQSRLALVQKWFTQKNHLTQLFREVVEEGKLQKQKQDQLQTDWQAHLNRSDFNLPDEKNILLDSDTFRTWIKSLEGMLSQEEQKTEEQLNGFRTYTKLEEISHALTPGKACPLCGSTDHPDIFHAANNQSEIQTLEKEKERLKDKKKALQLLTIESEKRSEIFRTLTVNLAELREKARKIQHELKEHEAGFDWDEYKDANEQSLSQAFQEAQKTEQQIQIQTKEIEAVESEVIACEKKIEKQKGAVQICREELGKLEGKKESIGRNFQIISPAEYTSSSSEELRTHIQDLTLQLEQIKTQYEKAQQLQKELEVKRSTLHADLLSSSKLFEEITHNLSTTKEQIQLFLSEHQLKDETEADAILSSFTNPSEEERAIASFFETLLANETRLEDLQKLLKDQQYSPEEHTHLQTEIKELTVRNESLMKLTGTLEGEIKQMEKDLLAVITLKTSQEKLQQRAEDLRVMTNLFKGQGFVEYISTIFLKELVERANDRFRKLSRNTMELQLDENNSFQIVDYLNSGRVRSVKTLSGGQTFQASLCLALTLADSINHQNQQAKNFFFLDEGFGTLDKDSLYLVFDTLKSLRKENRIVGVISHVEELQEEIGVHLRIENDTETGSKVQSSWSL